MATEIPHLSTLQIPAQIGSRKDFKEGLTALAKKFPAHFTVNEESVIVSGISYKFIDQLKESIKADKIKLSEDFELLLMFYLGWAFGKRMAHLKIVERDEFSGFTLPAWEEEEVNDVDSSDNS